MEFKLIFYYNKRLLQDLINRLFKFDNCLNLINNYPILLALHLKTVNSIRYTTLLPPFPYRWL